MKLLEFFQEESGKLSSKRLFGFLVSIAYVTDWMHCVFALNKNFDPAWSTISLVATVLGLGVISKAMK